MNVDKFNQMTEEELNDDGLDIREALEDRRCDIAASPTRKHIKVWWHAAPASSAPGGPWIDTKVRD